MTKADLYDFIAKQGLAVLATVSGDMPQSALVGIAVTHDLEIIFDTVVSSRKYRNLVQNPAASFVVGWSGEITLQYEGEARQPTGSDLARCKETYFAKFSDGPARQAWPGIAYFVVRPKWIRYSDYDQQPALIEEFTF